MCLLDLSHVNNKTNDLSIQIKDKYIYYYNKDRSVKNKVFYGEGGVSIIGLKVSDVICTISGYSIKYDKVVEFKDCTFYTLILYGNKDEFQLNKCHVIESVDVQGEYFQFYIYGSEISKLTFSRCIRGIQIGNTKITNLKFHTLFSLTLENTAIELMKGKYVEMAQINGNNVRLNNNFTFIKNRYGKFMINNIDFIPNSTKQMLYITNTTQVFTNIGDKVKSYLLAEMI